MLYVCWRCRENRRYGMDTLSKNELRTLLEKQKGACVSFFLPTRRAGVECQQDELRLRHQIRDAENRLLLENLRSAEVEILLEPLNRLLEDGDFWMHSVDGLAI